MFNFNIIELYNLFNIIFIINDFRINFNAFKSQVINNYNNTFRNKILNRLNEKLSLKKFILIIYTFLFYY